MVIEDQRRRIISNNKVLRMKGKTDQVQPVPPKPKQPIAWQATESNGDYIGCFYGLDKQEAIEELEEQGYTGFTLKLVKDHYS